VDLPAVADLLQGFLPSVVLLVFLAIMPYLLAGLIRRSGLHSSTAVDAQLIQVCVGAWAWGWRHQARVWACG
jgi:hypothetical protein